MILELKQTATGFLSQFDLFDLSVVGKKIRFGMATVVPKGQQRAIVLNMQNHIYRLTPTDISIPTYTVSTLGEDVGELCANGAYPSMIEGPRQLPVSNVHTLFWRGREYTITEIPVKNEGLYYQIVADDGETVAIIERGTLVSNEKDCFIACIDRDSAVAMVASAMAYLDIATIDFTRNDTIPHYALKLQNNDYSSSLDRAFLAKYTS